METSTIIAICVVAGIVILGLFMTSIRIVPIQTAVVVTRLGKYRKTLETGFNMILPLIDKTLPPISLKSQVIDCTPNQFSTKDNKEVTLAYMILYHVEDAMLYTFGVARPLNALTTLYTVALGDIVRELEAHNVNSNTIDAKLSQLLTYGTAAWGAKKELEQYAGGVSAWGIKIDRVELKS